MRYYAHVVTTQNQQVKLKIEAKSKKQAEEILLAKYEIKDILSLTNKREQMESPYSSDLGFKTAKPTYQKRFNRVALYG